MAVTLYNHIRIEKDDKPLVPNVIFKSLLHLIEFKDFESAEYVIKNYSFTPAQKSIYLHHINFIKNETNINVVRK
jgi:hypothetical protein